LIIVLSAVAGLLLFLNLLLNFPAVQTWLTHRVASYFSAKLHAKVEVGKVDFEFLKKLVLRNVYIQDQRQDTIFSFGTLKVDIGTLDFKQHKLYVSDIEVDDSRLHFTTYKGTHELNLQFIVDALASKDTTPKPPGPKWDLQVGTIWLNNIDLRLRNGNDTSTYNGIKFSDMQVHNINAKFTDVKFEGDTLRADIERLTAKEQSGFTLEDFHCYVKLSSKLMELDALRILTPTTDLSTDLVFRYSKFPDFFDFVNKVDMHAVFRKSKLCFDDISYFGDALKGVHNCFILSGEYSGKVNDLRGHNMDIQWGKYSRLQGDALLTGLPDIDKTLLKINITSLVTSKKDVESLPRPPFDKEGYFVKLPDNLDYFGVADISGSFNGYISDFTADVIVSTDIGDLSGKLTMKEDTANSSRTSYKGSLTTSAFDIGTFWGQKNLGPVTASVSIEGRGLSRNNADAKLVGTVQGFSFKKYNYTNLTLNGELRKGFFSGVLDANDPNLQMDFTGSVDIASDIHSYDFNASVAKMDLVKLNLIHDTTGQEVLATHVKMTMKGNNLDAMDGTLHIDSTHFAYHKDNYHLNRLDLVSSHNKETHNISMKSDYADVKLSGYFPLTRAGECVQNLMHAYIPSVFHEELREKEESGHGSKKVEKLLYHDYALDIHFNENTGLTDLFIPSLSIANGSDIKATYKESTDAVSLTGKSPLIQWAGKKVKDWNIEATGNSNRLTFKTTSDSLFISDSLYAASFVANGHISKDSVHYTIKWNNDSANYASIPGYIAFPNKTEVDFKFQNPVINLSDSAWQVNGKNRVSIDTNGIIANDMEFYHNMQSIFVQGKLSTQKNDAMVVTLKRFNLKNFNIGSGTDLQGTVDGTMSVANVYNPHPFFAGALNFSKLRLNKQSLGDGSVNSYWDNESNSLALNGQFIDHDTSLFSFIGNYYDRDSNNLSADITMHGLPIKIFQPYIKDYTSDADGKVSGNGHVFGNLNKPLFKGNMTVAIKRVKLDYLNTYYHSPGINVEVVPDTFRIVPSPLLDDRQDSATVSGLLTHNHFKDFNLDFNMDATDFMCLNTNEALNSLYYGKAYATGNVKIYGPTSNIHIDANITTDKGTVFNIPLSNAAEIDQGDFVRFTDKKNLAKNKQAYKVQMGGLQMDFRVHATPDATTNLIFAQKVGDVMTGTGYGTIDVSMNTAGFFDIRGNYTVTDGNYLFTLRNTFSKNFTIREGGTINWSGDPYNADINITASYDKKRTTLAPLSSLFPDDSTVAKKSYPYSCDMILKGKLQAPQISFNIDLPTVDANTRQVVDSYLQSNQDELDRQVFALLILNSFLPPQDRPSSGSSANAGIAAGLNSTEFLADELNSMLTGISNKFNVGFVYQPGTGVSTQELQVLFSTQLFNDRVAINSDVGTLATPTGENTNNIVGEVNVEYKVSKDGKLRLKAFNRANDNSTINLSNAPYTQGGGVSYRESFNSIGELWTRFKNKFKKNAKKEQTNSTATN
jgi:hypothetical protein